MNAALEEAVAELCRQLLVKALEQPHRMDALVDKAREVREAFQRVQERTEYLETAVRQAEFMLGALAEIENPYVGAIKS